MTDDIDSLHKQIRHFFHTFATFTRDGGAAWVTTSLTDPRVSALAIDPGPPPPYSMRGQIATAWSRA